VRHLDLTETMAGGWQVEYCRGPARDLHQRSAALVVAGAATGRVARQVRVLTADRSALVLGSGQPESDVDIDAAAAAGVEVVRRRSGGGAVLVDSHSLVWVDVVIPGDDPVWDADVGRAAWWVGAAWAHAVEATAGGRATVWQGGMQRGPWSRRVCFAGVGPGEVCIEGQKAVGISQRRTRQGALFQTAALLSWDPATLLSLLRLDEAARSRGRADLASAAVGLGPERATGLVDAFVAALP
jgi:lipoate-protein ligase A